MKWLGIAAMMLLPTMARAQDCAALDRAEERLACYDRREALTCPAAWTIGQGTDRMTDRPVVTLRRAAEAPHSCGSYIDAAMVITCAGDALEFYFEATSFFSADPLRGMIRLGDEPARDIGFTTRYFGEMHLPGRGPALRLIGEALTVQSLSLRVADGRFRPVTLVFSMDGLRQAVTESGIACGIPELMD